MRGKSSLGIVMVAAIVASLLVAIPVPAEELPTMYLDPNFVTVDVGDLFTVSVYIENVEDLYAFEFKVGYDIMMLTFVAPAKQGPFLGSDGRPTYFAWTYDPQAGIIRVGETRLGICAGVSGTGKIGELTFMAMVDGAGQTTTLDLYDEVKYDSSLTLIWPQGEPGDCEVQMGWPAWLWETELYLSAAKGGKLWTEWQVGGMEWDPMYGVIYTWEPQMIYARVINKGTAEVYVRVMVYVTSMVTGETDSGSTFPTRIKAGETVVLQRPAGVIEPWILVWWPDNVVFLSGVFHVTGEIQISLDGWNWYYWSSFDPALPGDGFSRVTPGGDTGKFKVTP